MIKGSIIEEEMIDLYKQSLDKDFNIKIYNKEIIIKDDKKEKLFYN